MAKARTSSIKTKLTLLNMLVSASALLLASAGFIAYELTTFKAGMIKNLSIRAQIIGVGSASAVLFNDAESAKTVLAAMKAAPNILFAGIYTADGKPLATYWRDGEQHSLPAATPSPGREESSEFTDIDFHLIRSIELDGKPVGTVYLRSDLRERDDRLRSYVGIVAVVLGMSLLGALAVSSIFQRRATQPLLELAKTARIVSRDKEYSVRAPVPGTRDEVATLIDAFNEMLGQIEERTAALEGLNQNLEQRVAERTKELETSNQELEAFTYSVAHDLRAPLRHVQGFSTVLEEDFGKQLDPAATECLQRIVESTQHMGHLIDDLLGLARIGRRELQRQVTGFPSLVDEVIRDMEHDIGEREIRWEIGDLPFAEVDPGLMKQVLYNLLANSVKYTRPRKPAVIEVGQQEMGGESVIFVRDNGVGFNMKYADKLFGVFQRLHRKEDFEGTGVGLATVLRIIQKHGGRIWAEAELGRGATFYFTMSAPAAAAPPDRAVPALSVRREER